MIPPLRLREDEDKGQVPGRLLRPPEARARERVPLQPVHHHQVTSQTWKQIKNYKQLKIRRKAELAQALNLTERQVKIYLEQNTPPLCMTS